MEDRKRPAGPDDSAPPSKRQAVTVNGAKSHHDADPPWKDDIESFQKDAILRQMREYKREKGILESQIADMEKQSRYHDDHLRIIDAWFDQMLDAIKIMVEGQLPTPPQSGNPAPFPASLLYEDSVNFSKHLSSRSEKIKATLSNFFTKFPPTSPQLADIQQQLSKQLAKEKEHICELQRVITEKEQMSERFHMATQRYMLAEKKIDRIKSAQVQKLEKQAIATSVKEEPSSASNGAEAVNGVLSGAASEEVETARNEAVAEAARRREQLEQLEAENKKLTEQVTSLNVKLAGLSDDDYAKTDLFKALKSQHEDVIKRINNLEATNIQLREEAQKYQAERTAYRMQIDEEARATLGETEGNLVKAEADLTRIRNSRDDLLARVAMLEAGHKDNEASKEQARELVSAREDRISALESECERLRLQMAEHEAADGQQPAALDSMTPDELRNKIVALETQYKLLRDELPSMEAAWKKAQAIASKKVAELADWEERIARANADKARADQKFFAAMKTKESLDQQLRILKAQVSKSTEIVAQLKEADSFSRSLVDKHEKQLAEMRAQMEELSIQHRALQQKFSEGAITSEAQANQIIELKKLAEAKDTTCLAAKHAQRESETERDKLKAQVEGLEKQVDVWKKKSLGNQSEDTILMRSMLQCQVCKNNFKNTVLKTCGHVFCDDCVQDRLALRARKCPNCGKAFGGNDLMRVHI
ncbi:E3 ubiquitin-protein ligase-like protein bre1 [Lindgomyces ingoldianus]|uniref:E3 ubiquitin-protein ligase-like protein bre1 n=1 Tax=Lindgomyces ingoldianus TaxID=673940 RepID=A0ACB6R432_9PLEO|nr:E3 ubiquitin-protein ligase-like protein bre1 [Lindgomyces ingoldianus]KAF2474079.1 E3 ubiquitin-protein ligase-like protein bre1 [Lindgomyces ingoldianus]